MKKQILVTGGAGFIGSHLCERLSLDPNNIVYSLDNYFMGSRDNHVDNVTYIEGDVGNIDNLVNFSPHIIYHLGEYSRVEQSFDDIEKVWKFNKLGIFAMLEFVRKTKSKLIYSGSSTKYSDGALGRTQSPYAWTKASNTELIVNYGQWYGISYAITYFYNVYGKREISSGKYATIIASFIDKMRKGEDLTVVNPGLQRRNFTHVDDIIEGLILVAEKGHGDEFGIGNPKSYSILEIAKMFGGNVQMLPERQGNRMSGDVITTKTEALGWFIKHNIEDYIRKLEKNNWKL
ncbi:NAD-dependent epimerase/dehydratase family protein [Candidatus Pseudothioglobus sp. Uisw_050_01]|uniref:NAD-dependent epimerase/dehydratase family protein n=1 Tax=Candidatus Pseudothioglobus sp. Uisw_050_01 TaxID=3230997 RepID=UPI003A83C0CC